MTGSPHFPWSPGDVLTAAALNDAIMQGIALGGGGGASVTVSDTPPSPAAQGDLWWNSANNGQLYIYYTDANSNQWVQANSGGGGGGSGAYLPLTGGTLTGDMTVLNATGTSVHFIMDGDPALPRPIRWSSNGTRRWSMSMQNTENGSATGSDWTLDAYQDDGATFVGRALQFARATGLGTVLGDPTAPNGIATKNYVDTHAGTGTGGGGPIVATPVRSTAMEIGHVLKASAGTCYFVDALNGTSTQALLVILDAASIPADGTVTGVIEAIPLAPNGRATFNPSGVAAACATGIVAYVSTNTASPFTKATSGVSAYFTGMVT